MNLSKTTRDVLASAGLALATAGAIPAVESEPGNPRPGRTVPTPGRCWEDELQLRPPTADRALAANGEPTAPPVVPDTDQQRLHELHPGQEPSAGAEATGLVFKKGQDGALVFVRTEYSAKTPPTENPIAPAPGTGACFTQPDSLHPAASTARSFINEAISIPGRMNDPRVWLTVGFVAGVVYQRLRSRHG